MNRAHEPGEAENGRWALAEHLRVGADHVVQCSSFTSLPLQEFIAVISQLDTVIISGDKNAAQSDRMFPQDNIAEVWNHHAGPGFRILSTDWYPGMKHTKMRFHKQRRGGGHKGWVCRRGEDWNATDLQWKIETSCVSVCLWCERRPVFFLKPFPRHQTTSGSLSLSLSLSINGSSGGVLVTSQTLKGQRERGGKIFREWDRRAKAAVRLGLKEVRTWTVSFQRLGNDFSPASVCAGLQTRGGGSASLAQRQLACFCPTPAQLPEHAGAAVLDEPGLCSALKTKSYGPHIAASYRPQTEPQKNCL